MSLERKRIYLDGVHTLGGLAEMRDGKTIFDDTVGSPTTLSLGEPLINTNIKSLTHAQGGEVVPATFNVLAEYKRTYPEVVVNALGNLYAEYNHAFTQLVQDNSEWTSDYQYCIDETATPVNGWVQIDMVGLTDEFLVATQSMSEESVREVLRRRTFEIENSLAMYQLLGNIFSTNGENTQFKTRFQNSLNALREKHGKPIALLAVTEQKYQAMRESEFGKSEGETLTDDEVKILTGFDGFFGPKEFELYLKQTGGECGFLLYARTSDPVSKLRKPTTEVRIPLLESEQTRQIIRANSVTFNIDRPGLPLDSKARINDTKAYMAEIGMGYPIHSAEDMFSPDCAQYLIDQGVDPHAIESRDVVVRAKPMNGSYGGYGHHRASLSNPKFIGDVRKGVRERGPYVLQSEMATPILVDEITGRKYTYIDRNFLSTDGKKFQFMGGFRSLMPLDTQEADRGRVHGNNSTVWAEIV